MSDLIQRVRDKQQSMMYDSVRTYGNVLKNITQTQATTLRDGPEGWTVLEVLCHVRDFDEIFRQRAEMIIQHDTPELPAYDHEQMAIDYAYNEEEFAYAFQALHESREKTLAFFASLTDDQWERAGIHPEKGHFTLTDAAMQVVSHDILHLEQITRILEQAVPNSGAIPSEASASDDD